MPYHGNITLDCLLIEEHISFGTEHSVCTDGVDSGVIVLKPRVSQAVLGKRYVMTTCVCMCVCARVCVSVRVCVSSIMGVAGSGYACLTT